MYKIFQHLIAFVLILYRISDISSYLISIDLGSEFFKATVIKTGRPFTMLENLQSKTKTHNAIAFKDDERFFGVDAINKKARIPKQVFVFMQEYLAEKYDSDEVKNFIEDFFVSYEMEEDTNRQVIKFKVNFSNEEFKFSTEDIFGMLFRYIKFLSDKFSEKSDYSECIITIPPFFGHKKKIAIAQAVEMSKLNLKGFIHENVAAATNFAIDKQFSTDEEYCIFYNMGSMHTQVTLVSYKARKETEKPHDMYKTVKIIDEAWEKNLGGTKLTYNLIRLLMDKFDGLPERQGMPSVKNDYRVAERMLSSATKYKEILSANKQVPISILGVESGLNLEGFILTREEFEKVNEKEFERVYDPIERILNRTGLTIADISQIELIGGSIRVPRVQKVLKYKLGTYSQILGTHLNGDDSMALGAAFIAANSSLNFKPGKKMDLQFRPSYQLKIELDIQTEEDICLHELSDISQCEKQLGKFFSIDNVLKEKDLHMTINLLERVDFAINIIEKFLYIEEEKIIMSFNITGVSETLNEPLVEDSKDSIKINIVCSFSAKGYINVKAELNYQKYTSEDKSAFKIMKKQLKIETIHYSPLPMTSEELNTSKKKLDSMDDYEKLKTSTNELRNALEINIYNLRELLQDEGNKPYINPEEIPSIIEKINRANEWFELNSRTSNYEELNEQFKTLNEIFSTIQDRKDIQKNRDKAITKFNKDIAHMLTETTKVANDRPWTFDYYNNTLKPRVADALKWLQEQSEKQNIIPLYEVNQYKFINLETYTYCNRYLC